MAEYTSEQYKFLLMKRLQRHFSMKNAEDRIYTQNFFCALFDESVTVTEEAYNNFCRLMDDEIALCAEKGWYRCEDIPTDAIKEQEVVLVKAFEAIGITLKIDSSSDNNNYLAIFTKPNSEIMTYKVGKMGNLNYFYINARAGTEYHYAVASAPAYNMQGMDVPQELGNPKSAGPGTYWSYNAGTKTMTISGDGAYIGVSNEEQIGSGKYTTVIIGANVSRLLKGSVTRDETTMVLLHPADGAISIDPEFNGTAGGCETTYKKLDVYTDCAAAIAALSTENQAKYITLHSLSEWEG